MERAARATAVAAAVAVVLLAGLLALRRFHDFDVLWHVRTGEWILAEGTVPRTDPFGAVTLGRPWLDVAWGAQVAMALIRRAAGLAGVQLAAVALIMAGLGALLWRMPRTSPVLVAAVSCVLGTWDRLLVRPDLLLLLMVPALLLLLDRLTRDTGRTLAGLAVLVVLWANLHGSFVLAPLVATAGCLAEAIAPRVPRRLAAWGAACAIAALAPVVNPNGPRIYAVLWPYVESVLAALHLRDASERLLISEWTPTWHLLRSGNLVLSWGALLLLMGVLALSLASLGRRLPLWRPAAAAALAALAAAAARNLMPLAVAALVFVALGERDRLRGAIGGLGPLVGALDDAKVRTTIASTVALASLVELNSVLTDRFYVRLDLPHRTGIGLDLDLVPEGAVRWLAAHDAPEPVFNNFDSGVYLLHRLYPHFRPWVDARVVDPAFVLEMQRVVADAAAFDRLVVEAGIGTVILVHPSFESASLLPHLAADPRWRLAFRDHNVTIHVRADLPEPRRRPDPWPLEAAVEPWATWINDRVAPAKRAVLPAAELTDAFVSRILGDAARERAAYRRALERDPGNARALAYFSTAR